MAPEPVAGGPSARPGHAVTRRGRFPLCVGGETFSAATTDWEANHVNILWIILIVILVLALLGFFSRGRW